MDTSDPEIWFDVDGVCNHCLQFDEVTAKAWRPGPEGKDILRNFVSSVKNYGAGKEYDCIIGLSGGVDSSYLALKVKELGLRPLVVHVDAGWNSELSVSNIESIVRHCGFELHTHVMNWEDMRRMQIALLKSGIPNQDMAQDHAFFANLYRYAVRHGIKYVLSGGNIATESIFPEAWHGSAMDAINLRAIYKRHGTGQLQQYPMISFFDHYFFYPFIRGMRPFRPLDYMSYNKKAAMDELERITGWRRYDRKHGESIFTAFFQNYFLPARFGYDKRRPHLSSLIMSKQMSRDEALAELAKPLYDDLALNSDIDYVCKKLAISKQELDWFIKMPKSSHLDYPNWNWRFRTMKKIQRLVEGSIGRRLKIYS